MVRFAIDRDRLTQEHLDYVIAHGNKLYVRTQAMELLDKLEPKEATPC